MSDYYQTKQKNDLNILSFSANKLNSWKKQNSSFRLEHLAVIYNLHVHLNTTFRTYQTRW